MKLDFKATKIASYIGYITQAIVNNLSPLLFVTFSKQFHLSIEMISILITVNFAVQITTDLVSAKYIMKLGYRGACVWAHVLATIGLVGLAVFPFIMPPFIGLILSTVFCAIGGGLDEVIISPVIEAIPGDCKESDMSLLHSFYSWGQMLVVIGSTIFFVTVGIENWRILPLIWAIVPCFDAILFIFVPIRELAENEADISIRKILSQKTFWLLFIIIVCAGASELAMSQWASMFAEEGLKVSKTMGDLLGPCMFAMFMGISRTIYGIFGKRMPLEKFMIISGILCVISYFMTVFFHNPILALSGCGLCGFSVGLMWPGTYSIGAKRMPWGGAKMFALLAFAGDVGCTSGPDVVGFISGRNGDIRSGLIWAALFPAVLVVTVIILSRQKKAA